METRVPNGRINLSAPPSAGGEGAALTSFPGFKHQTSTEVHFQGDMLRGNWEQNTLSDTFFSEGNVKAIQAGIRKGVYERSQPKGYIIDDQSVDELKIIMRAIFYQYAKNLPYDIAGQIADLNTKVLDWSVPHILSAVDHYYYYLNDIQNLPVPLAQPMLMTSAGTRTLPTNPYM